jgi:hypothetical protein
LIEFSDTARAQIAALRIHYEILERPGAMIAGVFHESADIPNRM